MLVGRAYLGINAKEDVQLRHVLVKKLERNAQNIVIEAIHVVKIVKRSFTKFGGNYYLK